MHADTPAPSPAHRFATLDGLRGLAALAVAAEHAADLFGRSLFPSAHLAVDLFFVLSGFVLAHAFSARLDGTLTPGRFMTLRLARLYPTYLLTTAASALALVLALLAGVPMAGWTWTVLAASLLPQLAMLPAPYGPFIILYPLNGPAWSLMYELVANLAWASAVRKLRPGHLAALMAVSAACMALYLRHAPTLNGGFRWDSIEAGFIRVGYSFPAGLLLFAAWRRRAHSSVPRLSPLLPLAAAALCFVVRPGSAPASAAYDFVAATLVLPAVVWLGASTPGSRFATLQRQSGLLSYPLYLVHVPLLLVATKLCPRVLGLPVAQLRPWGGLAFILAALGLSWCIGRFFETPVRAILEGRCRRCK